MPSYKNLIIDGKVVNLVNGSPMKNIIVDNVVYEPAISGYRHYVHFVFYGKSATSSSRPSVTSYSFRGFVWTTAGSSVAINPVDQLYTSFVSNDPTPITDFSELPDGTYVNKFWSGADTIDYDYEVYRNDSYIGNKDSTVEYVPPVSSVGSIGHLKYMVKNGDSLRIVSNYTGTYGDQTYNISEWLTKWSSINTYFRTTYSTAEDTVT